jgi:hypothetical protein
MRRAGSGTGRGGIHVRALDSKLAHLKDLLNRLVAAQAAISYHYTFLSDACEMRAERCGGGEDIKATSLDWARSIA